MLILLPIQDPDYNVIPGTTLESLIMEIKNFIFNFVTNIHDCR
jgi:hypothetical protein